MLDTPILFLIFNRPEITETVFEVIKQVKPSRLFIAADGPRIGRLGEKEKCDDTRNIVLNNIDWDCDVQTLFRDTNLGCKMAVSSAINWFFENVEEGIILEDDCLPDLTFFNYCKELLEKYRTNDSVMHISGNNFNGNKESSDSYYFSNYIDIWGWATWKRAWNKYNLNMTGFESLKKRDFLKDKFRSKAEKNYWLKSLTSAYNRAVDTWDYQWVYTIYSNNGFGITPYHNLVSNIGFGADATHTTTYNDNFSNVPNVSINQINHPDDILVNKDLDYLIFQNSYKKEGAFFSKIRLRLKKLLKINR